jgi:hypothetical protein
MLDLMEMRGFKIEPHTRAWYLVTPESFKFAIQMFEHKTPIECAFACFETLNPNYP